MTHSLYLNHAAYVFEAAGLQVTVTKMQKVAGQGPTLRPVKTKRMNTKDARHLWTVLRSQGALISQPDPEPLCA